MRLPVLLLLLAVCPLASAQYNFTEDMLVPDHAVKFSPMHLVSFYPTAQFSYEVKLFRLFTMQAEGGYVLPHTYDQNFQDMRGAKLKLEARQYFNWHSKSVVCYFAFEGYQNIVNFDRETWYDECFDGNCQNQYRTFFDFKVKYREHGVSLKYGMLWYIARPHFFLDVNGGFSIRSINYNKPEGMIDRNEDDRDLFTTPNEEDRVMLYPCIGIRIGYRIH